MFVVIAKNNGTMIARPDTSAGESKSTIGLSEPFKTPPPDNHSGSLVSSCDEAHSYKALFDHLTKPLIPVDHISILIPQTMMRCPHLRVIGGPCRLFLHNSSDRTRWKRITSTPIDVEA